LFPQRGAWHASTKGPPLMVAPTLVAAWWLVSLPAPLPPASIHPLLSDPVTTGAEVVEQRVIVRAAEDLLDLPMGAEHYETVGGKLYVFVLERHYHPPGFVGAPNGWHKGVTVYAVE
jgi:hypothetical protein